MPTPKDIVFPTWGYNIPMMWTFLAHHPQSVELSRFKSRQRAKRPVSCCLVLRNRWHSTGQRYGFLFLQTNFFEEKLRKNGKQYKKGEVDYRWSASFFRSFTAWSDSCCCVGLFCLDVQLFSGEEGIVPVGVVVQLNAFAVDDVITKDVAEGCDAEHHHVGGCCKSVKLFVLAPFLKSSGFGQQFHSDGCVTLEGVFVVVVVLHFFHGFVSTLFFEC